MVFVFVRRVLNLFSNICKRKCVTNLLSNLNKGRKRCFFNVNFIFNCYFYYLPGTELWLGVLVCAQKIGGDDGARNSTDYLM